MQNKPEDYYNPNLTTPAPTGYLADFQLDPSPIAKPSGMLSGQVFPTQSASLLGTSLLSPALTWAEELKQLPSVEQRGMPQREVFQSELDKQQTPLKAAPEPKPQLKPVTETPEQGRYLDRLNSYFPNAKSEIISAIQNNQQTLDQAGINTPARLRHFLSQMAWESGGFAHPLEGASGTAYEGRRDLGNINPGDGSKYKGRGIIQLTGRSNYENYGRALGVDLVARPELAADPDLSVKIAAKYWQDHNLNEKADNNDLRGITRSINGGYNGLSGRMALFDILSDMF